MAGPEQASLWHCQSCHCGDSHFTDKVRGAQRVGGISPHHLGLAELQKTRKQGSLSHTPNKGRSLASFAHISGILSVEMSHSSWGQHLSPMAPLQDCRTIQGHPGPLSGLKRLRQCENTGQMVLWRQQQGGGRGHSMVSPSQPAENLAPEERAKLPCAAVPIFPLLSVCSPDWGEGPSSSS